MTRTTASTGSGLLWGVHASFREYLQRLSDGRTEVSDGAVLLDDGRVLFPALDGSPGRFAGAVHFTGHHGMLALTLARPQLTDGALTVDDPFPTADPGARIAVVVHETHGSTRLTEEGSDLFLGTYPAGTEFDPLTVSTQPAAPVNQEHSDDEH